jgi:pimeloyl-ACP methyl ester carboxylesterase
MSSSTPPSTPTLVNIGTHSLALYTHGPSPATPSDPVLLFVPGLSSSRLVWAAVLRLLPPSVSSYSYDRSGFGSSELSPLAPTAENVALELSQLIEKAPVTNPLIIVAHSWAGVLIREFIALTGNGPHIAGLVLVDANHETTLGPLNKWLAALKPLGEGLEHYAARGIEAEKQLTQEEWEAFVSDEGSSKFQLQADKEYAEYEPSFETLKKKELEKRQPLLGDKPVFVIGGKRSWDGVRVYEAGVKRGNGTEEERRYLREMIGVVDEENDGLIREHLRLSTRGEIVFARESGHFVQVTQPDVVVGGVKWVLDELKASS